MGGTNVQWGVMQNCFGCLAELAEVDLAVVVGVVSAGHAKMLNTVKDKNRGSQSDRARPSVPMFSTVSPNIVAIYQGLVG